MERLLVDAGVTAGMRVADLGCGGGDVTCMLARLVGSEGHVTGVDRQPRALAKATDRAAREGLSNVNFVEQDLLDPLPTPWSLDAVVARRVLMYLPEPARVVRAAAQALRPGGVAVFQEIDSTITPGRTTAVSVPVWGRTGTFGDEISGSRSAQVAEITPAGPAPTR